MSGYNKKKIAVSFLVPTVRRNWEEFCFHQIFKNIQFMEDQKFDVDYEILVDRDPSIPTGLKRNRLLEKASKKFKIFFDDDDYQFAHRTLLQILSMIKYDKKICGHSQVCCADLRTDKHLLFKCQQKYFNEGSLCFRNDCEERFTNLHPEGPHITDVLDLNPCNLTILLSHGNNMSERSITDGAESDGPDLEFYLDPWEKDFLENVKIY